VAVAVDRRVDEAARAALDRATSHLLSLQAAEGWWKGELETNVTMDAEDLLLREFLGIREARESALAANWIRSQQRGDGTWANFRGGPPDLSTTVEAYAALRLTGDPPDAAHMRRAAEFVLDRGGLERARVFTHLWFALFGLWPWDGVPALPPEVVFLPRWFPLNLYDFACWARQTIAALTVVGAHRPVRPIAGLGRLDELRTGAPPAPPRRATWWGGAFERLDRALHRYERRPVPALRRLALARATEWILARQEADGSWGGIQPPWVYSLMALHLQGYPLDHPAVRAGLKGLEGFTVVEGDLRRLEACQSPAWDTALAAIALTDAGVPPGHPALQAAARWLLAEEVRVPGDWAVRRPGLEPSGWAFEFANDHYPDIDDTAEVVLALRRLLPGLPPPERDAAEGAVRRGTAWVVGMQSGDGGWGAFDADNTRALCRELPFCDFGEVIDPPSADVTAHVVEMLAAEGLAGAEAARRGMGRLAAWQEPGGSWFGRWGANHVYGTGAAVPAAVAAGASPADPRIRAAVRWLEEHQAPDGGWGEDPRSYRDASWVGRGHPTASQTAWALLALLAAGERGSHAVERGIAWLADHQTSEGTWDEPWFTGTGFPGDFFINYHLYRLVFPVTALGRYLRDPNPARTLASGGGRR
jgi:squalene-hopene/tetraprenyl-beta-curcumene cyclase